MADAALLISLFPPALLSAIIEVRKGKVGELMQLYGTSVLNHRSQAYQLLERSAAEHWGITPLSPVTRDQRGKPFFSTLPDHHFNLSHSGRLALCALDHSPVGVDIQIVKQWRPSLPTHTCSPEELNWLEGGKDFWRRFTLLWTLKECRVKQSGTGLTHPISKIRVPLPTENTDLYSLDDLWFRIYSGHGWQAAVCGLSPPPQEIRWITL